MTNSPLTIYKYRDWNDGNHKKVLHNFELYFTKPFEFNDPFDCKVTPNYNILLDKDKRDEFIRSEFSRYKQFEININIPFDAFKSNYENALEKPESIFAGLEKNDLKFINTHYGVASFSVLWDSILLWSHYGNKHKGFCVGFDEIKFRGSKKYMNGGMVQYRSVYPEIEPNSKYATESLFKVTHYKAEQWQYEKEYRIVKLIKDEIERIDNFPVDYINEIILGIEIAEKDQEEISTIAMSNNIPLFKMFKKNREFKLDRKQIF